MIKLKEHKNKDPKKYWKILKERNVNKSKTALTLEDFYHHFKNLSEENNLVEELIMKPEKFCT